MAKYTIKDENHYSVQGWMINRLGLKGTQLILYAIIYGFTQDGESEFRGGWEYLQAFSGGISKPTIINTLDVLVEKGYITRRKELKKGVWYPRYKAVLPVPDHPSTASKEILPAPVKKFNQSGKEILPAIEDTTSIYANNTNRDIKGGNKEAPPPSPEQIIQLYEVVCPSLAPVQFITDDRKEAIREALSKYTIEQITRCFELANASDFLKGANERKWKASFDWLIDVDSIAKVLEGNYENNRVQYGNFDTMEAFERALARSYNQNPEDSEPPNT